MDDAFGSAVVRMNEELKAKGLSISTKLKVYVYLWLSFFYVFGKLSDDIIKIVNLFCMPLYFVLSDLFLMTYEGLLQFVKKKTNKLLIRKHSIKNTL